MAIAIFEKPMFKLLLIGCNNLSFKSKATNGAASRRIYPHRNRSFVDIMGGAGGNSVFVAVVVLLLNYSKRETDMDGCFAVTLGHVAPYSRTLRVVAVHQNTGGCYFQCAKAPKYSKE